MKTLPHKHFPLPLKGEFADVAGETYILDAPFIFRDGKFLVEVPADFSTDFNSIPPGLREWFPRTQYPQAGVVHDFLYRYNGVTRGEADRVHRRILELSGCGVVKRNLAYAGLRAGGWVSWNRYRSKDKHDV